MDIIHGLMDFIDRSPTAFHAVDGIARALDAAGFERLSERDLWRLEQGGRYYLTRNMSSIIALRLPRGRLTHFQIVASHADSPAFKLKPNAVKSREGCALLNVEKYGGMLMSTWLDRPLSVAGRLIVEGDGGLEARLVNVDRPLAVIPNMPIHFNRKANDGVPLNAQEDMQAVFGMEGADLSAILAEAAGVGAERVVGGDLFLYNRDPAALVGADGEMISAPRLDDLECAYTSLRAFLDAGEADHGNVLCVFDNEEVGSGTKQGADSTLLKETLRRAVLALGGGEQAFEAAVAGSFMVSADNAHAAHPNHPDKYDAQNRTYMNKGVVVKHNANQKYTTDGLSAAVFERVCGRAGVPVQRFANRSDIAGGSTLGNISNAQVSMNAVDIGLAQLAMHSARELAGARDAEYMVKALAAFYDTHILIPSDGVVLFGDLY